MLNFSNCVAGVIIYKPNVGYETNITMLLRVFKFVYIILNSDTPFNNFKSNNYKIINNKKNYGLAYGQNQAITYATNSGFKFIALFDQDTLIKEDFLNLMIHYQNMYVKKNLPSASLYAPVYRNVLTNELNYHPKFKNLFFSKIPISKDKIYEFPDYVISSGSIIDLSALNKIGMMRTELFIDFIDIDWCFRSLNKNLKIVSFNKVIIDHKLGTDEVYFFKKHYPIHSPLRLYFFYRNFIYLLFYCKVNNSWKFIEFFRNILRIFFYIFFVKNKLLYIKYISLGIIHGLFKKLGNIN
jgi:rhamnosyltransferase